MQKIQSARHWLVEMPFSEPLIWGSGRRGAVNRLVVELTTDDGLTGFGETICLLDFIEPVLRNLILPAVIDRSASDCEWLHRYVLGSGYYHHKRAAVMALAAVEMAMWDIRGKYAGVPLHELWGGKFRDKVEVAAYLFTGDKETLQRRTERFLARGHRTFKVKLGMDAATDIQTVRTVRGIIGPECELRGDANGAWTIGTARRQLEKLRQYDLAYVEQPLELSDLEGHRTLRQSQAIPIALDESAYDINDVGAIIRANAADILLLDPHESGGLWSCIKSAAAAEAHNIPVLLHSGGELGLSESAYLHLAASIPNMSLAIDSEHDYLADDIVADRNRIENGYFPVPTGPGLGLTVDLEKLERYSVDKIAPAYRDPERPDWFTQKPAY